MRLIGLRSTRYDSSAMIKCQKYWLVSHMHNRQGLNFTTTVTNHRFNDVVPHRLMTQGVERVLGQHPIDPSGVHSEVQQLAHSRHRLQTIAVYHDIGTCRRVCDMPGPHPFNSLVLGLWTSDTEQTEICTVLWQELREGVQ